LMGLSFSEKENRIANYQPTLEITTYIITSKPITRTITATGLNTVACSVSHQILVQYRSQI
jgi:hypothetical protein